MTQEALKLALEALEACNRNDIEEVNEAITAIKEALAQPKQEPEAWMYQEYRDDDQFGWRDEILFTPPPNDPNYFRNIVPVYTTPPQRTWVGLTDDEIDAIYTGVRAVHHEIDSDVFARAIEAKLKDKNT